MNSFFVEQENFPMVWNSTMSSITKDWPQRITEERLRLGKMETLIIYLEGYNDFFLPFPKYTDLVWKYIKFSWYYLFFVKPCGSLFSILWPCGHLQIDSLMTFPTFIQGNKVKLTDLQFSKIILLVKLGVELYFRVLELLLF